jgi:hypothetical protein
MDGINWNGLVQRTNPFDSFSQGLQNGSELRQARIKADQEAARREAYNLFGKDPKAAEDALLATGDLDGAETIRKRREAGEADTRRKAAAGKVATGDYKGAQTVAIEGGDFDMAKSIAQMDSESRKAARERAEDLGGFALGIKGLPYEQRKSVIAQAKPILLEQGFSAEQIDAFDPTDDNIAALAASATDLKTALDQADKERDFGLRKEQVGETKRHNRTQEGVAARNSGIAASNSARGWAAHNARVKAGGYGTPGVGGVVADEDVEIDP